MRHGAAGAQRLRQKHAFKNGAGASARALDGRGPVRRRAACPACRPSRWRGGRRIWPRAAACPASRRGAWCCTAGSRTCRSRAATAKAIMRRCDSALEQADALELAHRPHGGAERRPAAEDLSGHGAGAGDDSRLYGRAHHLAGRAPPDGCDAYGAAAWRTAGKAVVLVSHDLCLALRTADRVALLADGRLCMAWTPPGAGVRRRRAGPRCSACGCGACPWTAAGSIFANEPDRRGPDGRYLRLNLS